MGVAMLFAMLFALPSQAQKSEAEKQAIERDDASICVELTQLAERTRRFPKGLLYAIARVESGRARSGGVGGTAPWPWTVTVEGDGRYYENKQQAVRVVEQMQRDGRSNIDVGCMQVNLYHHGRAFRTLSEALDPVNNVAYATEYLVVLYKRYNNWEEAIKHYHSSDPTKHDYYLSRVKRAWKDARTPRTNGAVAARKQEKKTQEQKTQEQKTKDAPVLSREEAGQLEREAILLSDGLRKKLGIVEQLLPENATEQKSAEEAPDSAQNLNAGFFLELIDKPL